MFNKIFSRGTGKATGIDYLLSPMDAMKKLRTQPPILMRGDPALTKAIINAINYKQKYTSGVLSWEESPGHISEKVLDEVMDSFESMVGAGIESDRLNWLWVLHQDKQRIELHYVIPNCDLQSEKRFSPYFDRVDRSRFRVWERYTNALHGFTDPSDPAKKRDLRLPSTLPREKARAIDDVHTVIAALVSQGAVNCRDDIINHLQAAGYKINRKAEEYISIVDESGRKLRLRGAFYEAAFTTIKTKHENQKTASEIDTDRSQRITQLRETLEKEIDTRSRYITKRYLQSKQSNKESVPLQSINAGEMNRDRSAESGNAISTKIGGGIDQSRAATDDAIQRTSSTLGSIEQAAAEFGEKLAGIERSFASFINRVEHAFRRLRGKVHESIRVSSITHKL